jgi:hypothetical protein
MRTFPFTMWSGFPCSYHVDKCRGFIILHRHFQKGVNTSSFQSGYVKYRLLDTTILQMQRSELRLLSGQEDACDCAAGEEVQSGMD